MQLLSFANSAMGALVEHIVIMVALSVLRFGNHQERDCEEITDAICSIC